MVLKSVEPDANFINLYVYNYRCECGEMSRLYLHGKNEELAPEIWTGR